MITTNYTLQHGLSFDRLRKHTRQDGYLEELTQTQPLEDDEAIEDDRLRLIFTCCHPSLAMEARVALSLREVCGLTTEAHRRGDSAGRKNSTATLWLCGNSSGAGVNGAGQQSLVFDKLTFLTN